MSKNISQLLDHTNTKLIK